MRLWSTLIGCVFAVAALVPSFGARARRLDVPPEMLWVVALAGLMLFPVVRWLVLDGSRRPAAVQRAVRLMGAAPAGVALPASRRAVGAVSAALGLKLPMRLWAIRSSACNAFIVGRTLETAALVVTTAFARLLTQAEQAAVFAALASHLKAPVILADIQAYDSVADSSESALALYLSEALEGVHLVRDPGAMLSAMEKLWDRETWDERWDVRWCMARIDLSSQAPAMAAGAWPFVWKDQHEELCRRTASLRTSLGPAGVEAGGA